jgi:hypothetical protein
MSQTLCCDRQCFLNVSRQDINAIAPSEVTEHRAVMRDTAETPVSLARKALDQKQAFQ